jgi:hypothetical protein
MHRHYDDISLRFATMSQAGVLIFIGLAFGLLSKDRTTFLFLFPFVIVFVTAANIVTHAMFRRHVDITKIKINRLLELEKQLGWRQFSLVDEAIKARKVGWWPVRKVLRFYHLTLPIVLVIAYLIILMFGNRAG